MPRGRALIAGGGIAGLAAALALRQAGYDVTIFERAGAIEPAGSALSLWPNAIAALDRLGVGARVRTEAAPIATMVLADRRGGALFGPHPLSSNQAFMVTRALLQSTLREALGAVDLRLGQPIAQLEQNADSVAFTLIDGTIARGDIAIVADGIWSPTATELLGNPPRYRGYGGVLALSDPVAGLASTGIAAEYQGDGARFGVFDIGNRRQYWFYMHDTPEADIASLTLGAVAERALHWPAVVRAAIAATPADRLLPFAVHARPAPRRLGHGRVLCVGDAAHAMEPNLGQGACQALEDAVALGSAASIVQPDAMLATYQSLRLARIRAFVRQSSDARHSAHGSLFKQRMARAMLRAVPSAIERRLLALMHDMPAYPLASLSHSRKRMTTPTRGSAL
ncbi:NAD(P)/FAD-dependent oxidoreductase [Sphingomonas qilianensis]|uniref:NAD(P)/FAD-dependent oxidoreductase n=1 Tax=Sphingomonas qilianensis TaxID=1736690 RepID=A0ABU9XP84_9SPHN